jgi:chromosome segregation ATPase
MSEEKQEIKLESVELGKQELESKSAVHPARRGALKQLQADQIKYEALQANYDLATDAIKQLQARIKELERLLAVMEKQSLIDDETEKELSAELESLRAELAKKDARIQILECELNVLSDAVELSKQEYREQIKEIFSKLRWDIRTQAVENIITWDAVSLVIKKYESKYLSQPEEK